MAVLRFAAINTVHNEKRYAFKHTVLFQMNKNPLRRWRH